MPYYLDESLEQIREVIASEIRSGVTVLSASYLVQKFRLETPKVQKVLADLVRVGDLEVRYRVLCSGEQQNYDIDREYSSEREIPTGTITCSKCGDLYKPDREHILIVFEPTTSFRNFLFQKAS